LTALRENVVLPAAETPVATATAQTIELWFKTSSPGVLVGFITNAIGSSQTNYLSRKGWESTSVYPRAGPRLFAQPTVHVDVPF
jgi:hypothetical protein